MSTVQEHYSRHLGPIYSWMVGGFDAAISRGEGELDALGVQAEPGSLAVDLGAGFGMHAIPLARRGFKMVALDTCQDLLDELQSRRQELQIATVKADLLSFQNHLPSKPTLILCMGDTITHLPDRDMVASLVAAVSSELSAGGRFVVTLRDYTLPLVGDERFIPVRSDATRIFSCFLEYDEERVTVHDILYQKDGSTWKQSVSSYQKLRLSPKWLRAVLEEKGFAVKQSSGPAGMILIDAQR
jgi:2-polyprenyl-3-methyl-5-hydroxy-6-metoxy-1,4-benzoquinol methylase